MVSIIIPVYQVEAYLPQCLDSVLGQTYSDIQVILVDDGSPDSCGRICDEYAQKDSRVLALHKENGGVSSARNFGLEYVEGAYVTFCDSDDWYAPDWIEALVNGIQQDQADVAVGNYVCVREDGSSELLITHESGVDDISHSQEKVEYVFEKLLTAKHGWEVWTRLYSMEAIRREKIRFCETCGNYAEDFGFSFLYTLFANRVVSIENAGYRYRIRGESMMQTSSNDPKLDSLYHVSLYCHPPIQQVFRGEMAELVYDNLLFYLLGHQFSSNMWASHMDPVAFRKRTQENVAHWPSMENHIRTLLKKKQKLGVFLPPSRRIELFAHLFFLLGMPWIFLRAVCKLTRTFRPTLDYRYQSKGEK